jgi:hypothetical protein
MVWTPSAKSLAMARAKWIAQHYPQYAAHYAGTETAPLSHLAPDAGRQKRASWIATELLPLLVALEEQGYDVSDRSAVAELLEQEGHAEEAGYISGVSDAEWNEFIDFRAPKSIEAVIREAAEPRGGTPEGLESMLAAAGYRKMPNRDAAVRAEPLHPESNKNPQVYYTEDIPEGVMYYFPHDDAGRVDRMSQTYGYAVYSSPEGYWGLLAEAS